MADYYLVERVKGPAWDRSRGWREHPGWEEHAAFMNALAGEGFIVLGGPLGGEANDRTLLVVAADDETAVRTRFAHDPWPEEVLAIASIRPWSVWLRRPSA